MIICLAAVLGRKSLLAEKLDRFCSETKNTLLAKRTYASADPSKDLFMMTSSMGVSGDGKNWTSRFFDEMGVEFWNVETTSSLMAFLEPSISTFFETFFESFLKELTFAGMGVDLKFELFDRRLILKRHWTDTIVTVIWEVRSMQPADHS